MSNIRRYFKKGNIYFLTHVTYQRQPILSENMDLLLNSLFKFTLKTPYNIIAWVILPEHFHVLIDPFDNNLSLLMRKIKLSFSSSYRKQTNLNSGRTWQYRFWDHVIRDETDMNNHIDYIHYNPVKHGLVERPFDWKFSSIHNYKEYYQDNWGVKKIIKFDGEFGE